MREVELPVQASDSHRWSVLARIPSRPGAALLWLPALGVAARHYLAFADALAARGIAVFIHECRGHGSSSLRAGRETDWGYRELLEVDLPASESAMIRALEEIPDCGASRIIGGHSLGGQLACCRLAMQPEFAGQLWLVASGAPYWRAFPPPARYGLPLVYRFLPWLADHRGALPGHQIGFGGNEARGVIADWARTALSGHYAAKGLDLDLEAALQDATPDVSAVVLADDWLAPESSLRFLLSKMSATQTRTTRLDAAKLGTDADHIAWMKAPVAVVDALLDRKICNSVP